MVGLPCWLDVVASKCMRVLLLSGIADANRAAYHLRCSTSL